MTYLALGVEYNGSAYNGFQLQPDAPSIQGELEKALSIVGDSDIHIICAGRTDSGVHATGQVISFESPNERPLKAWLMGVNANLPQDISITWAHEVNEKFSARFSAFARRYRYIIYNGRNRPAIGNGLVSHYYRARLDENAMNEAAQCLLGENDFSTFRGAGCQSRSPMRNVSDISVTRRGSYVILDITANAFLLHMVRNIAGSLIEIGLGKQPISWMEEIFKQKNRNLAGPTALPDGLYLVDVSYPPIYELPKREELGPFFINLIC